MSGRGLLDADMRTVGVWSASAVRWWLDQLAQLVPARWRSGGIGRRPLAHYDPLLGVIDYGNDLTGKVVVLPDGLCLVRRIERPVMSDRDVARMVSLDADRIMPLGGAGTIVAGRAVTRDPGDGVMTIEVAGLPRGPGEALCARIVAQGGTPAAVLASEPDQEDGNPIDLLPALRQAGLLEAAGKLTARWWMAAGFLILLNIGILIWRDAAAVENLEQVVATQQPAIDAARRIKMRIAASDRISGTTLAIRDAREPLTMLARVAAALPPGAWLQRYSWQGDTLRLAGYRPAKADVSGALRAAGLGAVRYDESAVPAATPLGQPFEITVRIGGHR